MYSEEEALDFERKYGEKLKIGSIAWNYYKLGNAGTVLLFLTGGLRRARFGYAILEKLSAEYTLLALDYPPVESIGDFIAAIDGLLASKNIKKVILIGQSYGGIIAQAYMLYRPEKVSRLILSNSGPLQFSIASRFALKVALKVVDFLSEKNAKRLFCKMILQVFPKQDRSQPMAGAVKEIVLGEFKKADVHSHFSVVESLLPVLKDKTYKGTTDIFVLQSEDDRTQSKRDIKKYVALYGEKVQFVSLGNSGHAAMVTDEEAYFDAISKIL